MAVRRAAWREARKSLLRALRSFDHDPERSGQWPPDLPDRRRTAAPCRVRYLPHRPVDGRSQGLIARRLEWLFYGIVLTSSSTFSWTSAAAPQLARKQASRKSAASEWK